MKHIACARCITPTAKLRQRIHARRLARCHTMGINIFLDISLDISLDTFLDTALDTALDISLNIC
ncbi:MAG: hypothetical protein HC800_24115 [Phormidesmis sp. RL_2_1]|nr:hypothetical protein [Phormidesmis sp. RL_2_1]